MGIQAHPWLFDRALSGESTAAKMRTLRSLGVPYSDADIEGAAAAVQGKREIDALVAYLQGLGTLIQSRR